MQARISLINERPRSNTRPWYGLAAGLLLVCVLSVACANKAALATEFTVDSTTGETLSVSALTEFDQPWAMTFMPGGQLLVTEKPGRLWLLSTGVPAKGFAIAEASDIEKTEVLGVPPVDARGQGGLGDVVLHPDFNSNQWVYLSFVERDGGLSGAAVIRARLDQTGPERPVLTEQQTIWRQQPKVSGHGHYGHRMVFSDDGLLFITSGERQKFDPAQDMSGNLGKVIRLLDDGQIPEDNPWFDEGGIAREFWSIGHRNPLGIAFDTDDSLWMHEMGPRGGDELNRIVAGENYGYPAVSEGRHYSGRSIPDHNTRPEFKAPEISWTPVISPSGLVIYRGDRYPQWRGSALITGLSSRSLVRVALDDSVAELERFDMGRRMREVEADVQGVVYLLEDGAGGRLLRLNPL